MLELVFVIVVAGILAAVFIPRFERDNAGEAAYQIARHIRLAQHHALVEDRFNAPNATTWKATFWRITFVSGSKGQCYQVWADRNASTGTIPSNDEKAVDPLTKKYVWGGTTCSDTQANVNQDVLLWKSYGVTTLTVGDGTIPKNVAFDHLGRPGQITNLVFTPLADNCVISIDTNDGHSAEITVYKETGFVKVTKIDATDL